MIYMYINLINGYNIYFKTYLENKYLDIFALQTDSEHILVDKVCYIIYIVASFILNQY